MTEELPKVYIGRERQADFWRDVGAIEGGGCSPGKAADMLGCSRQYVEKMILKGRVRAYIFKFRAAERASYVVIPFSDIEEYARKHGKWKTLEIEETVDSTNRSLL